MGRKSIPFGDRIRWVYESYRDGLLDILSGRVPYAPLQIEIHPYHFSQGLACNHACEWCTRLHERARLSSEQILGIEPDALIKFILSLKGTGIQRMVVSGNTTEPLLYPRIDEVIKAIKDAGLIYRLYSNFYHGDKIIDVATATAQMNDVIRISLDAGTEDSYNRSRHPVERNSFIKVLSNIEALLQARHSSHSPLQVSINYLLTEINSNEEELRSIISWAQERVVDAIYFAVPQKPTHQNDNFDLPEDHANIIKSRVEAVVKECNDCRMKIFIRPDAVTPPQKEFSACNHCKMIAVVGARGMLLPCTSTSIKDFVHMARGDINSPDFDFWKIWREANAGKGWIPDVSRCPDCTRFEYDLNLIIDELMRITKGLHDRVEIGKIVDAYFEDV